MRRSTLHIDETVEDRNPNGLKNIDNLAGQFYEAVHCKLTRQLRTEARMGLKT